MRRYVVHAQGADHEVELEPRGDGRFAVRVDGQAREVDVRALAAAARDGGAARRLSLLAGDCVFTADLSDAGEEVAIHLQGVTLPVRVADADRNLVARARNGADHADGADLQVRAPIPGKVVRCLVRPGDAIAAGQPLVIVEAMKMENELRASRAGRVREVAVREGQAVESGETLIVLAE